MALVDQNQLAAQDAFQVRVMMAVLNYVQGTVIAETTNEVQSVAITGGTPTSGAFVLNGGPMTSTVTVAFNDTASSLQAKIAAVLPTGGTVQCLGGPLPGTAISVTFTGSLGNTPQLLMTTSGSTLSPAGTAGCTRTTAGVGAIKHSDRLILARNILDAPDKYKLKFTQMVTTNATVMTDYTGGGNLQTAVTDAHIATAVGAVYDSFLGV